MRKRWRSSRLHRTGKGAEELEAEEERIADICQAAISFALDYDAGKIREALHHKNA